MKQPTLIFWLTGGILLLCLSKINSAQAQKVPVPDTTLPVNSVVNSKNNINTITGGTRAGGNLFHSFGQFNIDLGQTADFVSPSAAIANIFVRVTGNSRSEIMGTLSTSGLSHPNLFLINPYGIVFGPNARLNVGGSFVATTADAIAFGNQGFFSASAPNNPSLLTINPSAFFFNQITAAAIENKSIVPAGFDQSGYQLIGLRVPDEQSLLLLGPNVTLDRGNLHAVNGRVELGGLAQAGTVGLNVEGKTMRLSYPPAVQRADVFLTNGSQVNVTGTGIGSIAINAQNLNVSQTSSIQAGIGNKLKSDGTSAGDITLDAAQEINISTNSSITNTGGISAQGNSGNILINTGKLSLNSARLDSSTLGNGTAGKISVLANQSVSLVKSEITTSPGKDSGVSNGGDINIQTDSLQLTKDSILDTTTSTPGRAGNVTIKAQKTVSVESNSVISSQTFAQGNAGTINITAGELTLTGGGEISSLTFGKGNAGNINIFPINVSSSVTISGVNADPKNAYSSGLVTSTEKEGAGLGGNITVTTGALRVSNGGVLSARTRNASPGGNIIVNANTLEATDGGQILASSFGKGSAGNITVNATDKVSISGSDPTYFNRLQQSGPITLDNDGSASGVLARVRGQDAASAGDIQLTARSLHLDNLGVILATTTSGEGGNINLQLQDLLLMRHGSNISTTAGMAAAGGNGGNITINMPNGFIVTTPGENTDITANAYTGSGGRVQITAHGIYGIQSRNQENPLTNDITASSQFGVNGTVEINTPDIDPNQGLVHLPTEIVEPKLASGCQAPIAQNQNSFIITGRGGLPPNPRNEPLSSDAVQVDWVTFNQQSRIARVGGDRGDRGATSSPPPSSSSSSSSSIVEATGWVKNAQGEVFLTANPPIVTPHNSWQTPANCQNY